LSVRIAAGKPNSPKIRSKTWRTWIAPGRRRQRLWASITVNAWQRARPTAKWPSKQDIALI
jgi:hypothetical protein